MILVLCKDVVVATVSAHQQKAHKTATTEMVLFDMFNKDGKIAVQLEYYDPTPLIMAMK